MQEKATLKYKEFIAKLDEQLQSTKCKIWRNPQITATREADLFATRVAWSIVRVPIYLLVDYVNEPTAGDFISFFEEGLIYSKRAFSGGNRLKVWGSSFAIIPCIACEEARPDTVTYVLKRQYLWRHHMKLWTHGFEFLPVLYSLKTNEVHYWKGIDFVGGAVYPFARKFVEESILRAAKNLEV